VRSIVHSSTVVVVGSTSRAKSVAHCKKRPSNVPGLRAPVRHAVRQRHMICRNRRTRILMILIKAAGTRVTRLVTPRFGLGGGLLIGSTL